MKKHKLQTRLESIPLPIAKALRQLLGRTRKVILIRGICAVIAVFVGMTLIAMGLDAGILIVSPITRWMISAVIYIGTAAAIYVFLVAPFARSFTLAGLAHMIEAHHPEMQERLSSAVELLTTSDDANVRGSQKLIDALTEAATADAESLKPKNEISMKAALPFFAAAAAFILIMAAIFAVFPRKASFLLARATAPFANLPNIMALDLEVRPGDVFVPRGERLEINLSSARGGIRSAKIQRTLDDGRVSDDDMRRTQQLEKDKAQCFTFAVTSVERNFTYRVQADDAITKYYRVSRLSPPVVESLDLKIDYPEYSCLPQKVEANSTGTVSALAGSVATISIKVNKPCSSAVMKIEAAKPVSIQGEPDMSRSGECRIVFRLPLTSGLAGIYSIQLTDDHGLKNTKFERAVQALADIPPVIVITNLPQKEIRLRPDDHFPFYFFATDDVGLKSVEILYEKDSVKLMPRNVALPKNPSEKEPLRKFEGNPVINLTDSDLRGVRRLMFQLVVSDNLPENLKGAQKGFSEQYVLVIDDNAKSFKEQALQSQEEALKNQLQQAKRELEESKQKVPFVKEVASKNEKKPEQLSERTGVLRENLANGDATLRNLSEKLSDGFFDDVSKKINELHDAELSKAKGLTDQLTLAESPEERNKLLEDITKNIDKAIAAIDDMLKKSETASKAMEHAVEIENLANRQEDLAKQKLDIDKLQAAAENAANMDPELKKKLEEWKKRQDNLADTLAKLAREQAPLSALKNSAELQEAGRIAEETRKLNEDQKRLAESAQKISEMQKLDKKLGELAEQQNTAAELAKSNMLKEKTAGLLKEKGESMEAQMRAQTAELEKRQAAVAEEAKSIAAQVAKELPSESKIAGEAKDSTGKAKDSLHNSDLGSAVKNAAEAAKELNTLTDRLEAAAASQIDGGKDDSGKNSPAHSPVSQLAKKAGDVAQAQEMLQKEIGALANGTPLENLVAQQENIEKRAEELKKDAQAFQMNARELNLPQKSQQLAAEGENNLQGALQNADNAGKSLGKMAEESRQMKLDPKKNPSGNLPNELKQAQDSSAKSLDQAAAKMAEAQKAIDDAAKNLPAQQAQSKEGEPDLPAASALARKAAVGQDAIDAIQSAESLNSAAQEAMAMAAKAGINTTPGKMSSVSSGGRNDNAKKAPPGFDEIARRMGIKYDDWLRLPGNLRSEILQSSASEGPEEYREIIRRYFEELSKRGMEGR